MEEILGQRLKKVVESLRRW